MRSVVVGFGIQGKKRLHHAGRHAVGVVDPVYPEANYQRIEDVPLDSYDAALVCTPDEPKLSILRYLLSHGKHVLVEKPMFAKNNSDLAQLRELALEKNRVCYTAYNHRFEPHFIRMKEALGRLGEIYHVKLFYGNGTARDVRNSEWRDQGAGVLPDLGSHLLDTIHFWLDRTDFSFRPLNFDCFENRSYDHVHFSGRLTGSSSLLIDLEATLLSWRNTFRADVFAEKGSAHIECLCKWGPSTFTLRERVLPSGRPKEETETLEQPDPTWKAEYEYFSKLCQQADAGVAYTNLSTDLWINTVLNQLTENQ